MTVVVFSVAEIVAIDCGIELLVIGIAVVISIIAYMLFSGVVIVTICAPVVLVE